MSTSRRKFIQTTGAFSFASIVIPAIVGNPVLGRDLLKEIDIKSLFKNTKSQTYDTSYEEYGDNRLQEPTYDGNYRMKL